MIAETLFFIIGVLIALGLTLYAAYETGGWILLTIFLSTTLFALFVDTGPRS